MIDISYLVSTFFPTYQVYEDWLDGKVRIIKTNYTVYRFFYPSHLQEIKKLYAAHHTSPTQLKSIAKQFQITVDNVVSIGRERNDLQE